MLKIGVPSKGRLMEKTFDWFGARGVTMARTGNEREYSGAVDGVDGVELVLLSAGEIPRELAAGRIHLGVTGTEDGVDLMSPRSRLRLISLPSEALAHVCGPRTGVGGPGAPTPWRFHLPGEPTVSPYRRA